MGLRTLVDDRPEPSQRACGDTLHWARWIPAMWQALADTAGTHRWPGPTTDEDMPAWRYTPAVHLLVYSLGWSEPAVGLRWWYDLGRPLLDPRFELLNQMLGHDLDLLAGWYWTSPLASNHPVRPDPAWIAEIQGRPGAALFLGDGDALHLSPVGGHMTPDWAGGDDDDEDLQGQLIHGSGSEAVLVVDYYAGWYHHLTTLGSTLPARADGHGWRVEVLCRPVGSLGIYRHSWATGRWFAGRHAYHSPGCPPPGANTAVAQAGKRPPVGLSDFGLRCARPTRPMYSRLSAYPSTRSTWSPTLT